MSSSSQQGRPLAGKVALVTGAGRGLGRGIAVELGQRGASVVVNYNSAEARAKEVVAEIEKAGSSAVAIKADVSKVPEIKQLFQQTIKKFGKIDIVVSNSGTEMFKPEDKVTEEDYDRVFNLNTRAQFFVAQQAYVHLEKGGRIILMSSVAATMAGISDHALYAGSKAAIGGFARSFAVDCGHKQITVNAIAPGGVKTDMYDDNAWRYWPGASASSSMDEIDQKVANSSPLKRLAVSQDIARVVAFLSSPDSEWVNGQVLLCTGGSY
ncbi:enoyl-(Acyl carrier protein) reductase [Hirsutella rhossiliensis]|uniref:Enoyl-(Acyl carrier protein) reductase domain-containing protein n=1 Tax=Hirsutella rhossiliensis TaxID=111463 RepID=A0A9P8N3B7_9HYPO|nr:enoyl-(Acyl carrier protein) reductase domain-containing protein [Hirsutella rhossiliensis]KAH0966120.1 enoyl-(Acyl carrier protein) reductase domain-containing protein [Hirsutella rhossiliensis]